MKKIKINIGLIAGMVISFGLGILIQAYLEKAQGILTASEFGEYTGGGVATLFTLGGILLFVQALQLQREDIQAAVISRNASNDSLELTSKIQLITGRIQANAAIIEAKKIDGTPNRDSIKELEEKISSLEISLGEIMIGVAGNAQS